MIIIRIKGENIFKNILQMIELNNKESLCFKIIFLYILDV